MLRGIAAVVVGYIVIVAIVMGGLIGAFVALGPDRAFQAGSFDVTRVWLAVMFGVSLIAALFAGWIASKVAAGPGGVKAFAIVVLLLGLLMAGMEAAMEKPDPGARTSDVAWFDAMQNAKQPLWVAFLMPVVGFVGVSIGGRGAKRKV